jgi:2-phospho-L-lactate transferase/gluconeogenesis factor (CofD/UPF0052 family)
MKSVKTVRAAAAANGVDDICVDDSKLDEAVLRYFRAEARQIVSADNMTGAQRAAQAMSESLAKTEHNDEVETEA